MTLTKRRTTHRASRCRLRHGHRAKRRRRRCRRLRRACGVVARAGACERGEAIGRVSQRTERAECAAKRRGGSRCWDAHLRGAPAAEARPARLASAAGRPAEQSSAKAGAARARQRRGARAPPASAAGVSSGSGSAIAIACGAAGHGNEASGVRAQLRQPALAGSGAAAAPSGCLPHATGAGRATGRALLRVLRRAAHQGPANDDARRTQHIQASTATA